MTIGDLKLTDIEMLQWALWFMSGEQVEKRLTLRKRAPQELYDLYDRVVEANADMLSRRDRLRADQSSLWFDPTQ